MHRLMLPRLAPDPDAAFPQVDRALAEPDGLLAFGGDLSVRRLRAAYAHGIFPWYSDGQPILWWSPALRAGFDPAHVHISRRLVRWMRRCNWKLATDTRFDEVVAGCASPRGGDAGTWITREMRQAYFALHLEGDAHSIEVLDGDRLVGGLYGVATGGVFCAESMFSAESNASKLALLALASACALGGWSWIDAQIPSPHLDTLGARSIHRRDYLTLLRSSAEPRPWPTFAQVLSSQPETFRGLKP